MEQPGTARSPNDLSPRMMYLTLFLNVILFLDRGVNRAYSKRTMKNKKQNITLQMSKAQLEALKELLIGLWLSLEFDAR